MTHELTVVGGAYGEECAYPRRVVYRGSGGRASALLSSLGVKVEFVTYLGPQLAARFEELSKRFKFQLAATESPYDVWFRYRHPLARPERSPALVDKVPKIPPIEAMNALVFGMIEGRPRVHADTAVYDAQDSYLATRFDANGSTADHLAIVVSLAEARTLTGLKHIEAMARVLLKPKYVEAVVIKCGPPGAYVASKSYSRWVNSFNTERVYKIGSGDAFSAAFAFQWILQKRNPFLAAWYASRAAASYVATERDRFSDSHSEELLAEARKAQRAQVVAGVRRVRKKMVYLAAPFFSTSQQWLVDEIRASVQAMGFRVFSPIHDVGEGLDKSVAEADLVGLRRCGVVLAVLDGLDTGTTFEIGYARSRGIPVVVLAENVAGTALTMLQGTDCKVVNDLSTAVYHACWQAMSDG